MCFKIKRKAVKCIEIKAKPKLKRTTNTKSTHSNVKGEILAAATIRLRHNQECQQQQH